jgi:hypothetical protein
VSLHIGAYCLCNLRIHPHALRALGERNGQVEQTPRTGNGFEDPDLLHQFPCMVLITLKDLVAHLRPAIRVRQHKRPGEIEAGVGDGEVGPTNNRCTTIWADQNVSGMKVLVRRGRACTGKQGAPRGRPFQKRGASDFGEILKYLGCFIEPLVNKEK